MSTDQGSERVAAEPVGLDRRDVLRRGFIWGSVGAASALAARTASAEGAPPSSSKHFFLDVACLGYTLRVILSPDAQPPANMLGSVFYVEGAIYRGGAIKRANFNPRSAPRIGTWICRGWFMITPGRSQPHVITQQEYVLGAITPRRLFPPNHLASSGMEGSDREATLVRSLVGGTGRYAGATGTVVQAGNGVNTTRLNGTKALGDMGPAPNFRFEFRLR